MYILPELWMREKGSLTMTYFSKIVGTIIFRFTYQAL